MLYNREYNNSLYIDVYFVCNTMQYRVLYKHIMCEIQVQYWKVITV